MFVVKRFDTSMNNEEFMFALLSGISPVKYTYEELASLLFEHKFIEHELGYYVVIKEFKIDKADCNIGDIFNEAVVKYSFMTNEDFNSL